MKLINKFFKSSALLCSMLFFYGCTNEFENSNYPVFESDVITRVGGNVLSKIALLHMNPIFRNNKANIENLESLVSKAFMNGATTTVTPELATSGYCITKKQVFNGSGLIEPFDGLPTIKETTIHNNGCVFVGLPEIANSVVYNTIAAFDSKGHIGKQRKRAKPEWHEVGNLPNHLIL